MSNNSPKNNDFFQAFSVGGDFEVSGQNNYVDASLKQYIQEIHEEYKLITPESVIANFNPDNIESPYKALESFDVADSEIFQGRKLLIRELLQACESSNLILVLGASGSGKSSVIKAGLIPEFLKQDRKKRHYFLLTPGQNPFRSLKLSLEGRKKELDKLDFGDEEEKIKFVLNNENNTFKCIQQELIEPGKKWLIFIDQFEQLFTDCQDLNYRKTFIESITEVAQSQNSSLVLILAMRADFLEKFAPYPQFGRIAQKNIHLVAEMYPEELEMAIKWPAAKRGVVFQAGLVPLIISQLQGRAGVLPLLQYTLHLLWEYECQIDNNGRRGINDYHLNIDSYDALGGIRGALQTHVEEVYTQKLKTSTQQETAKQIFLKLMQWIPGESGQYIVVSRRRLYTDFKLEIEIETLQIFIQERLIVSSTDNFNRNALHNNVPEAQQATVEIAHEILLSAWERLKGWIEEAKDVLIAKSQLRADMARYAEALKKDETKANEELLIGSRLERILEFWDNGIFEIRNIPLETEEIQFIEASIEWRDRLLNEKRDQIKKLTHALKKVSLQEQISQARSILSVDPQKTLQLTISALGLALSSHQEVLPSVHNLLQRIVKNPNSSNQKEFHIHESIEGYGDFEDMRFVGKAKCLHIIYYNYESELRYLNGDLVKKDFFTLEDSPSGNFFCSKNSQGTGFILDARNKKIKYFNGHFWFQSRISPNEKVIAALVKQENEDNQDSEAELILLSLDGVELTKLSNNARNIKSFEFSPDSCLIYARSTWKEEDKDVSKICIWNTQGRLLWESEIYTGLIYPILFSSNSKQIISELRTDYYEIHTPVSEHSSNSYSVERGWHSGVIFKWDIRGSLQEAINHEGYMKCIVPIGFDSESIICSDNNANLYFWYGSRCLWERKAVTHRNSIDKIVVNLHQRIIATIEKFRFDDYTRSSTTRNAYDIVCLWDFDGNLIRKFPAEDDVFLTELYDYFEGFKSRSRSQWSEFGSFYIDSNIQYITSVSILGQVSQWDWSGNLLREVLPAQDNFIKCSSISSDGNFLATLSVSKVKIWDLRNELITQVPYKHQRYQSGLEKLHSINFLVSPSSTFSHCVVSNINTKYFVYFDKALLEYKQMPIDLEINFLNDRSKYSENTDEHYSVYGSEDVYIEGLASGTLLVHTIDNYEKSWKAHNSSITSIAYCSQSKIIATGSSQGEIKLWSLEGESLIDEPFRGYEKIISLSFSPDGEILASVDRRGNVCVWRVGWLSYLKIVSERLWDNFLEPYKHSEIGQDARETCNKYVWHPKAEELNQLGLSHLKSKSYREAIQLFSESLQYNPEFVEAYYNRGYSQLLQKNFQEASKDLIHTINLIKFKVQVLSDFLYYAVKIKYLKRRRDYSFSHFSIFTEDYPIAICLLQSNPNIADVYFYRGWSFFQQKHFQQAQADWQAADKLYRMQMSDSINAKKVKEFLNHPAIIKLSKINSEYAFPVE